MNKFLFPTNATAFPSLITPLIITIATASVIPKRGR